MKYDISNAEATVRALGEFRNSKNPLSDPREGVLKYQSQVPPTFNPYDLAS
jgi:hypothetical protein